MRAPIDDREQRINFLQDVLPDLVALARIPEARGKFLYIFIRSSLQHAWDLNQEQAAGFSRGAAQEQAAGFSRKLLRAAQVLRAAGDAIDSLDEKERDLVELALHPEAYLEWEYSFDTISEIADALDVAARKAASALRRGRPPGTVKNEPLRSFVMEFYRSVVVGCAGKLSFNSKNGGSGTLIRALRLIEPCLPSGFLPKALPAKSIERWIDPIKSTTPKTKKNYGNYWGLPGTRPPNVRVTQCFGNARSATVGLDNGKS
jgi:hypothetical protein